MSTVDASNEISSLYPPPPPYMRFFTQENLDKLPEYLAERERKAASRNENGEGDGTMQSNTTSPSQQSTQVDDTITCDLDFLIPPPMPSSQQYRAFGSVWQVKDELPDLEAMGITKLYETQSSPSYQYKIQELSKLLKSLLLNYLELIGILSVNPELYEPKVENIRTILINIHHLLNDYRPHQSRESLIMLLEEQLEYKKMEIKQIEGICKSVYERLQTIRDALSGDGENTVDGTET